MNTCSCLSKKLNREQASEKLRLVEEIQRSEVPEGMNMVQWALAWCLKHAAVTSVIPGCRNVEQVDFNAATADLVSDDHPQAWRS